MVSRSTKTRSLPPPWHSGGMAEILLFHHVLGRTEGVVALADRLRSGGHVVHAPDLFDGQRFDSIEAGVAHVQTLGFEELIARAVGEAARLPVELVYAGISLGVMPAQHLAQTRPGARGALFLEACAPLAEFGTSWPDAVPVQVHGMDQDPFFAGEGDLVAARDLVAAAAYGELFLYPGSHHLFTDASLPSYDEAATDLVVERMLALLGRR